MRRPSRPGLPWTGPARAADLLCWGGIILSGVYYLALTPLRPLLIGHHPVVLELLTGSTESLVAGGAFARVGTIPLALVAAAAVPGLIKFDVLYWWAGRRWGPRIIELFTGGLGSGRRARPDGWRRRLTDLASRFTGPAVVANQFLPIPSAVVFAAAGWSGIGVPLFLLLDAAGALLWAGALIGAGYALGHRAVDLVEVISRYGLWLSLLLVAAIVARAVWNARRARLDPPAPVAEQAGD